MRGPSGFGTWTPEGIIRAWAQAYRETPEHRFPCDPNAEFFPVDLDAAAAEIERLRAALTAVSEARMPGQGRRIAIEALQGGRPSPAAVGLGE